MDVHKPYVPMIWNHWISIFTHCVQKQRVSFGIDQDRFKLKCLACNSRQLIRKGSNSRRFRSLPIGRKPTFNDFYIPRIKCLNCGIIRQVKIGFADSRRTYTKAFERYVLELSRHMTIKDVAKHLNTSGDIVKNNQKAVPN